MGRAYGEAGGARTDGGGGDAPERAGNPMAGGIVPVRAACERARRVEADARRNQLVHLVAELHEAQESFPQVGEGLLDEVLGQGAAQAGTHGVGETLQHGVVHRGSRGKVPGGFGA